MPEILRTRDVIVFVKGEVFTANIDNTLAVEGWTGGTGCQYVESPNDEFIVTRSDGYAAGFLLWGSDEVPDDFTGMTRNQPTYKFGVVFAGGGLIATSSYERYTLASRGGGPLVPITYNPSDRLFFSLRGLWTKENEWTLSGDPRAPNASVGSVAQVPTPALNDFMTIQVVL